MAVGALTHMLKVSRRKKKLAHPISHTAISTSSDTEAKPSDGIGEVSGKANTQKTPPATRLCPDPARAISHINVVWLIYIKFCISQSVSQRRIKPKCIRCHVTPFPPPLCDQIYLPSSATPWFAKIISFRWSSTSSDFMDTAT